MRAPSNPFFFAELSRRRRFLGKALMKALEQWRNGSKFADDDDFVSPDTDGGYTRHTNFIKRNRKSDNKTGRKGIIELAAIEDIGWHVWRHFAIPIWIEAGLSPKAVQTLTGHATFQITMDRYGHLSLTKSHKLAMDKNGYELFAE